MSSDESFLWTSASNSNSDSDCDRTSHNSTEMKSELKDGIINNEGVGKHKKLKSKCMNGESEKESSHSNCIKDEPISDVDSKIVKNEFSQNFSNTIDKAYNDSYLNLRVKEEQLSCFDDSDIPTKKKKKNKKRKHSLEENDNDERYIELENNQTEVSNYEDKITIEETVITKSYQNEDENEEVSTLEDTYAKHKKKKKKSKSRGDCDESNISEITCLNNSEQTCIDEKNPIDRNCFESDELECSMRNVSKVSDRIQFEEDISGIDSDKRIQLNESTEDIKFDQKQLRRYLKKNTNLQPISSKTKQDSIITDRDDVWLLKCPQDVDIMLLKDIPLSLRNKTKLKMGGKVYDYRVDNNNIRLPIMTYQNQNKLVIKTLTTNGCILLKNKVPKVHIPGNEIMVNDQTNFIPLPDTKCRHPLFGIHYKKLIKVPAEISKRLDTEKLNSLAVQDTKEKRRKHKKNKKSLEILESQDQMKVEQEVTSKRKKRKLSSDTTSAVKSKKVKYDPDSAPTWDSEKAIEENLFNF